MAVFMWGFLKRQVGKGFCKVSYILSIASCLKIRALSPEHFLTMFVIMYSFIPLCAGKHNLCHEGVSSLWKSVFPSSQVLFLGDIMSWTEH